MAKLDDEDRAALDVITQLHYEKYQLQRRVEEEMKKIEAQIFSEWDQRMTQAVTYAKNRGIANRQIGMACKTTNHDTARKIVDKYWTTAHQPLAPSPEAAASKEPSVVVTGSREAPLLTLSNWRAHAKTQTKCMDGSDTPVLNLTEEPLRWNNRWHMTNKADGPWMVAERELGNQQSELHELVLAGIEALGD